MAKEMVWVTWSSHRDSKKVGKSEQVTKSQAKVLVREGLARPGRTAAKTPSKPAEKPAEKPANKKA